jgi:hypothetical protein
MNQVSVALSGSESSDWISVSGYRALRVVTGGSGADVTYKLEGSPDGGTTVYEVSASVTNADLVNLADDAVRVTAANASATAAETADCWLVLNHS